MIVGDTANHGFNSHIQDIRNDSTISHHYNELLQMGAKLGLDVGYRAQFWLDGRRPPPDGQLYSRNDGDMRLGYFAVEVGDAVARGELSPVHAAQLTKWAFEARTGRPWNLNLRDYEKRAYEDTFLVNMIQVFNTSHSADQQIPIPAPPDRRLQ